MNVIKELSGTYVTKLGNDHLSNNNNLSICAANKIDETDFSMDFKQTKRFGLHCGSGQWQLLLYSEKEPNLIDGCGGEE